MRKLCNRALALILAVGMLGFAAPGALAWERRGEYKEGLALAVSEDGERWGYVNGAGSLMIPLRFSAAEPFFLGTARVTENGLQGVLRQDGSYLLPALYERVEDMGWGVYAVQQGETWSLLSVLEPADAATGCPPALFRNADAVSWETREDGEKCLTLRWSGEAEGEETVTALSGAELSALLRSRGAPGWALPLDVERKANFLDVSGRDWFDVWVDIAYSAGLMEGRGGGLFHPAENLTVCEALKLVALMDSSAAGEQVGPPAPGEFWYSGYLRYCTARGLLTPGELGEDYDRAITRAELALLFSRTALFQMGEELNDLQTIRGAIPDVHDGDYASSAIFALYAKGVVTGSDSALTFRPEAIITRAEVAAIAARLARSEYRVRLALS